MAAVRPRQALRTLSQIARPAFAPARVQCCSATASRSLGTSARTLEAHETSSPSSPSSSSSPPSSRYPTTNQHLYATPPTTQLSYLESLLAPLNPLPNPDLLDSNLAQRCLTHKSGVEKNVNRRRVGDEGGRNGSNEKMSFVGRRLLRMYLSLYLTSRLSTSNPALLAHAMSPRAIDAVLDTKQLGATVGHAWNLERGMRWREVRGPDGEMTGLWKVRGMGVEAVLGGVFTSQGIETGSKLFHQLVLPNLVFPQTLRNALDRSTSSSTPEPSVVTEAPRETVV